MSSIKKTIRMFSIAFKKEKVSLIEQGKLSVSEISKTYEVSKVAIYKWINKYGKLPKNERVVIEKTSEQQKNIELLRRIRELEQVIGKQQMQIIYKESVIEEASKSFGVDIEKKYNSRQSKGD